MRILYRAVLAIVAVAAIGLTPLPGGAQPASAIGPSCKEAPTAAQPNTGSGSVFSVGTKGMTSKTSKFIDGVPRYDQYGASGMQWSTYDLGCGPDVARNPGAVVGNFVGNALFEPAKFTTALTAAVTKAAYEPKSYMSAMDGLLTSVSNALRNAVFNPFIALSLAIIGAMLLWASRRGKVSDAMRAAAWAVLVMVIAITVARYPVQAGGLADDVGTGVLGGVHKTINGGAASDDPGDAAGQSLYSAVLYEQWKRAQFGVTEGPIINKYAADTWDSLNFSRGEMNDVNAGRADAKEVADAKAEKYEKIADEIKDKEPATYRYFTGQDGNSRVTAAGIALVAATFVIPFLLMSAILLVASFVIIRIAVMLFPAIAVIGINYSASGMVKGVLNSVAAAVVNSVLFGVCAAVLLLLVRTLLGTGTGLPWVLAVILVAVVSVIMWFMCKPLRRLTKMASPNSNVMADTADTFRNAGDSVKGAVMAGVGAAITGGVGGAIAGDKIADRAEENSGPDLIADDRSPAPYRTVAEPQAAGAMPQGTGGALAAGAAGGAAGGALAAGATAVPPTALPAGATVVSGSPVTVAGGPTYSTDDTGSADAASDGSALSAADATPVHEREDDGGVDVGGQRLYVPGAAPTASAPDVAAPDDSTVNLIVPEVDDEGREVYDIYDPSVPVADYTAEDAR